MRLDVRIKSAIKAGEQALRRPRDKAAVGARPASGKWK
jgi:hypothetical protein